MPYELVLKEVFPERTDIGVTALANYLKRRGYHRRIALRKPILSAQNRGSGAPIMVLRGL